MTPRPGGHSFNPPIVPVIRRPEYSVGFEVFDGLTVGHMIWHQPATRASIKQSRADLDLLTDLQGGPLYSIMLTPHDDNPAKYHKFTRLMGAKFSFNVRCIDGIDRPVFVKVPSWEV